jgi:hypothetical protein
MNPIKLNEWRRIADQLREACGDDDDLFADMVEGETYALEVIARLHNDRAEALELIEGIKARENDLKARRTRLANREAALKTAIGQVLRAVQLPKAELPEATYSVRDGKPRLEIVDTDAVPFDYCVDKPVPDKAFINARFADADELPNWLTRIDATDVISVRTK